MWKLLATAYPEQFRQVSSYRCVKIEGPRLSMGEYLGLVTSDSVSWRVVLTLAASHARVPELVEISSIRNLAALEIVTPSHAQPLLDEAALPLAALSDRIVRTWSELATASGAFAHLRVLVLYQQPNLSRLALQYLRAFPSLQMIMVLDCPGIVSVDSEASGWEVAFGLDKPHTLYECYRMSLKDEARGSPALAGVPVLDFQVGQQASRTLSNMSQKPWTVYLRRTETEKSERGEPAPKRPRVASTPRPPGAQRAVMKTHKGKDLGGVLQDFL
ncbi:hypothetical protein BO71DRAFT_394584 [Aspergillus ellipticus CBS 707.79]|uniref:Uncharacterized protein n=1 Tax=Aspergillus ellipticus CBS 707.79 TaxID=1448320 RepID=A0A319DNL2_9EURO|nr:hypothetical protein BO71DRAFT_394584 [Aspergillus ellipticus CBS 707.79]